MSFAADVGKWAEETKKRTMAVVKDAAQNLAMEIKKPKAAGGNMPVRTGNLRRSLLASTTAQPRIGDGQADDAQINLIIAGMKEGDTLYFGFSAAYARRQEYGFVGTDSAGRTYNQAGNGFVRLAVQNWQQIVMESAQRIRSNVEARRG